MKKLLKKQNAINLKINNSNISARKEEAELKLKLMNLELMTKKEIAEIERQTAIIGACVSATIPGESLKEEMDSRNIDPRTGRYHVAMHSQTGTKVLSHCIEQYYNIYDK